MNLIHGDCLVEMAKLIEDDIQVDLILTDPPYNISQKNHAINRANAKADSMRRKKSINYDFGSWDNMERKEFLDFTSDWFNLCMHLLKDGGAMISFFSKEDVNYLGWLGKEYGMRTRTIFTWHKTNPVPSFRKVNYLSSCEYAWIGSKGEGSWTFNFKQQKEMHNFFETPNKSIYGETDHPTEKPLSLIKHFVEVHTNPDDLVLDCFMGSGTTGVACNELGRNFIGIELDENYFNMAKNRMKSKQVRLV